MKSAPFVVPVALFAMTAGEFNGFRKEHGGRDADKTARLTHNAMSSRRNARPACGVPKLGYGR